MALETLIQSLIASLDANTAALNGASPAAVAEPAAEKKAAAAPKPATAAAPEKKAATAAEKKAAAAAAKKNAEVTDEVLSATFAPLLAKSIDAEQLESNKQFVATINSYFGVARLRDIAEQADRTQVVAWGTARAEDGDFEIPEPESEGEDDGGI